MHLLIALLFTIIGTQSAFVGSESVLLMVPEGVKQGDRVTVELTLHYEIQPHDFQIPKDYEWVIKALGEHDGIVVVTKTWRRSDKKRLFITWRGPAQNSRQVIVSRLKPPQNNPTQITMVILTCLAAVLVIGLLAKGLKSAGVSQ